jgi:hypothetical protein
LASACIAHRSLLFFLTLEYITRATGNRQIHLTSAGSYHALPTEVRETYFPDVYGQGAGHIYRISAH